MDSPVPGEGGEMSTHTKSTKQIGLDRIKTKEAAILWWSQGITRIALDVCNKKQAYTAAPACYKEVMNTLADAVNRLKTIRDFNNCVGDPVANHFLKANAGRALPEGVGKDQAEAHSVTPGTPPTHCEDDADCPEDYICDDGGQC